MSLNVSNIASEEAITFRSDHRASLHPNKMNAGVAIGTGMIRKVGDRL